MAYMSINIIMGDIQHKVKGSTMTFDDTRDNTTIIEDTIIEADEREGWFKNQTAEYYEHHTDYDCP